MIINSKSQAYYIALREHLRSLACTTNIYSKEYANLNKRIHIAHEKAYQIQQDTDDKGIHVVY